MKTCSELEIACLLSAMIALRTVSLFAVGELGVMSTERLGVHTLSHHSAPACVLCRVTSCLMSLPQHR